MTPMTGLVETCTSDCTGCCFLDCARGCRDDGGGEDRSCGRVYDDGGGESDGGDGEGNDGGVTGAGRTRQWQLRGAWQLATTADGCGSGSGGAAESAAAATSKAPVWIMLATAGLTATAGTVGSKNSGTRGGGGVGGGGGNGFDGRGCSIDGDGGGRVDKLSEMT
jgi:hypothetical protein